MPTTTLTCSGATDVAGNVTPPASLHVRRPDHVRRLPGAGEQRPDRQHRQRRRGPTRPSSSSRGSTASRSRCCRLSPRTTYAGGTTCTGSGDALEAEAPGSSQLTFDAATNTFQYNWKTPSQEGLLRVPARPRRRDDEDRDLQPQVVLAPRARESRPGSRAFACPIGDTRRRAARAARSQARRGRRRRRDRGRDVERRPRPPVRAPDRPALAGRDARRAPPPGRRLPRVPRHLGVHAPVRAARHARPGRRRGGGGRSSGR